MKRMDLSVSVCLPPQAGGEERSDEGPSGPCFGRFSLLSLAFAVALTGLVSYSTSGILQ